MKDEKISYIGFSAEATTTGWWQWLSLVNGYTEWRCTEPNRPSVAGTVRKLAAVTHRCAPNVRLPLDNEVIPERQGGTTLYLKGNTLVSLGGP
ncbi:hypothetical protein E2C01_063073 [Portunus trituberculatus]|uniref:Uncharacterized protein n=1 Tax=Portunus trituberculatus TaxID=210409 RepID=A0A5B7HFE1_PORTR|nr:hypothetical protein [Portunus trituberculatus]